jgi:hypothetical protein
MKNLKTKLQYVLYILLISLLFTSCENKNDVMSDLKILKNERTDVETDLKILQNEKIEKINEIDLLNQKLKELKIYESGKTPQYILKIHLKQSHFSLDIGKHMKDSMNSIDFELPVDKDFYNSVSIGTNIVDEFRSGSFILNGSMGNWKMTVKDKEIR